MKKTTKIVGIVTLVLIALALFLTIGIDTSFGKVEVKHLVIPTADGDEINCLMYKPKSATAENPAPAVMFAHGGNDMAEQMTSYCIELSKRGYVCITRDATGSHWSDSPKSGSEVDRVEAAGYRPQGLRTILNTLRGFTFVDQDHIVGIGHSLGGTNSMSLAVDTGDVFLSINLGQNMYGKGTYGCYDYNYFVIVGDADEAVMMNCTPQGDTYNSLQTEVLKRVFLGDYTTAADQLPNLEFNHLYTVTGSDGNTYHRIAYQPASTHAYYLCTNDAVQTVVYAITSECGVGLDAGVKSYEDHSKISTTWQWHDIGYFCTFLAIVGCMFFVASALLQTPQFSKLVINRKAAKSYAFKRSTWQWWVCAVVLSVSPLLLFKYGIIGATEQFLGIKTIKKLWLLGGNNNVIIAWQWYSAILMIAVFCFYYFTYGKKNGATLREFGFVTSEEKRFDYKYILLALAFGLIVVGSAYAMYALMYTFTKEGIHITTFMLSLIHRKRVPAFFMYFLFQIPYFLVSSLAFRSLGIGEGEDDGKTILKTIGISLGVSVGLLFLYWVWWIIYLTGHNTVPQWFFDRNNLKGFLFIASNKIVVYNMLILPMCIGMAVANAINVYVVKKTKSVWAGLFPALLWGTWMLVSCGDLAKIWY